MRLEQRVDKLEAQGGGKWPLVVVWRDLWETDASYRTKVAARVRDTGWTGPLGDYPGNLLTVSWENGKTRRDIEDSG